MPDSGGNLLGWNNANHMKILMETMNEGWGGRGMGRKGELKGKGAFGDTRGNSSGRGRDQQGRCEVPQHRGNARGNNASHELK